MDPLTNPYTPGAGFPPPELAGREQLLANAELAIKRNAIGRPTRSLMFIGLRGVGKTVLLREIQSIANKENILTNFIEINSKYPLAKEVIRVLQSTFLKLDRINGVRKTVKRGLRVLKSFVGAIKVKYKDVEFYVDIDKEPGIADSGNLVVDMTDVFLAAGEAAKECDSSIVIFIDEIQKIEPGDFEALISSIHQINQNNLPLMIIGAGLPNTIRKSAEIKSYVERLFEFPEIGSLNCDDAKHALTRPAEKAGVSFNENAVKAIVDQTKGYPYFIQEWGYQTWNVASKTPITVKDVNFAGKESIKRLDENFFKVRFVQLSRLQQKYLKAMAQLGQENIKSGDVAKILNQSSSSLGPIRKALINNGMIYSTKYGYITFSVPLFEEYLNRTDLSEI